MFTRNTTYGMAKILVYNTGGAFDFTTLIIYSAWLRSLLRTKKRITLFGARDNNNRRVRRSTAPFIPSTNVNGLFSSFRVFLIVNGLSGEMAR